MKNLFLLTLLISTLGVGLGGDVLFREDKDGNPTWDKPAHMPEDVFTFCRIKYQSTSDYSWVRWSTDFPDADRNFSFRLQQLTSMQVNPEPAAVTLRDREVLKKYPFVYMVETGNMALSDQEIDNLRFYLLNGGFLLMDDSWGDSQWFHIRDTMQRVFPDRNFTDLDIDHPIFHTVFDMEELPQVPSINIALAGKKDGITYEANRGPSAKVPHYRAYHDDQGRMCCLMCHNTDLGDGWEREGVDPWYFREFAEKLSFPMGINIVVYAMSN